MALVEAPRWIPETVRTLPARRDQPVTAPQFVVPQAAWKSPQRAATTGGPRETSLVQYNEPVWEDNPTVDLDSTEHGLERTANQANVAPLVRIYMQEF